MTRGNGYPYATTWLDAPVYLTNALNGLPTVDFGAQGATRCLQWSEEIAGIQAVFWSSAVRRAECLLGAQPGGYGG